MPSLDIQKLYELAGDNSVLLAEELYNFDHFLNENPKVGEFLADSSAERGKREEVLKLAYQAGSGLFKDLLDLMLEKELFDELPWLAERFVMLVQQERGVRFTELRSAFTLENEELNKIKKILGVEFIYRIVQDSSLIGGFKLTCADGRVMDASVKGQLERLKMEMAR